MPHLKRLPFVCNACTRSLNALPRRMNADAPLAARAFSTSSTRQQTAQDDPRYIPRWQQTPPAMQMPIRLRPRPNQPVWRVNQRVEPLDEALDRFIGRESKIRGSEMLSQETKWLAITHKSFDHGRRGNNDRLAYLGKRLVDVQTSLALLQNPPDVPQHQMNAAAATTADLLPFQHPSLSGVDSITQAAKHSILSKTRLAALANQYGIDRVVRWKPRNTERLQQSGVEAVLSHVLYALVGAISLERGGDVAAKIARERILEPLGLK